MPARHPHVSCSRLIAFALLLLFMPGAQAQAPRHLALVGGMLLDGYEAPPVHHAAIVIEGNKIVDHGMSPERVISALTRINARIYGKPNDLGTIEAGKLADIIVVDGNPLFDIVALSRVETVVKDGVLWKKDGVFVDASAHRGTSQPR